MTQDGMLPLIRPNVILGQNSSVEPTALADGEFQLLQNVRLSERVPVVRQGSKLLANAPGTLTSPSFRGAWSGTLNGVDTVVAAYASSGQLRVMRLDPNDWSWTEITFSSNPFGNNYLPVSDTLTPCEFCKVPCSRGGEKRDLLLIYLKSSEYPLVWDPLAAAGFTLAKLKPIALPGTDQSYKFTAQWPVFVPLQDGGITTENQNDDVFKVAYPTSPADPGRRLTLYRSGSSTTTAYTATVHLASGIDLRNCRQLILRVEESSSSVLMSKLKLEIGQTTSTWTTIGDPTDITRQPVTVPDDNVTAVTYYGYSLDDVPAAVLASIAHLRFTSTARVTSTGNTVLIGLIAGSGNVPGLSDWCVAYRNAFSRAESPSRVIPRTGTTPVTSMGGCPFGKSTTALERIPDSELLFYSHSLQIANPNAGAPTGTLDSWPTVADFYIRYSGAARYGYYASKTLYSWVQANSRWEGTSGSLLSAVQGASTATTVDEAQYPPDSLHGCIPRPTAMLYNGSRLFFAGDLSQPSELYFSEDREPFRFQVIGRSDGTNLDPSSGCRVTFASPIVGMAMTGNVVSGVEFGIPSMVVWTRNETWKLFGLDADSLSKPTPANPHGLARPSAWTRYEDSIYWLDHERQVRKKSGEAMESMSRGVVDLELRSGKVDHTSMAFYRDRLYIAFRKADEATFSRLLVWDEHPLDKVPGSWTEDKLACDAHQLLVFDDGKMNPRLLMFAVGGEVWEHEEPTMSTDNGSPIEVRIRTRDLHETMWTGYWVKSVGLICDGCPAGSTADVVVTYKPDGATASWTAAAGNALSLQAT